MAPNPSEPPDNRPRAEPEIIPPGAPLRPPALNGFADSHFAQRIYIAKVGPVGIMLLALAIGLVLVAVLVLLVGAFLLWIPVIGLLVVAAMLSGTLRAHFRRRP